MDTKKEKHTAKTTSEADMHSHGCQPNLQMSKMTNILQKGKRKENVVNNQSAKTFQKKKKLSSGMFQFRCS